MSSAREYCFDAPDTLLVDTSRRPREATRELATAMGARYVTLPYPEATAIKNMVQRGAAA
jgi:Mg-chelatase subunit ChlD